MILQGYVPVLTATLLAASVGGVVAEDKSGIGVGGAIASLSPLIGQISGTITRSGQPVSGVRIRSCYERVGPDTPCPTPVMVVSDASGRFSFLAATGFKPWPPGSCRGDFCTLFDPGFGYWIRVGESGPPATYVRSGMGWGLATIKVDCELEPKPALTDRESEERAAAGGMECEVQEHAGQN